MSFFLALDETRTRPLVWVRCLALLTALLLAPWVPQPVRAQALPTFTYAGVCGEGSVGSGNGLRINQIVRDAAGNSYVTGLFFNSATFGTFLLQNAGFNMFVAKLDPVGNVLWAVRVGGAYGSGIAVNSGGNIFVTGEFAGTTAFGPFSLTSTDTNPFTGRNAFVAKLDQAGTFLWAVRAGGSSGGGGNGIVVDATGNSYVCGSYEAVSSTADFGPFRLTSNNNSADVFIAKISAAGTFLWATGGGGFQEDDATGIALDAAGSIYITGSFKVVARFGTTTLTSAGDHDILVAKLSPAGVFQWAVGAGGGAPDLGQRLAVDNQGVVHLVGYLMSVRPVFGATILSHPNQSTFNAFVATLTPAGTWQWAVQGGGPGDDYGYDLALDPAGNTYAVGSCSYRATFGATVLATTGDRDVLVCKINPAGAYVWAIQAGGTGNDEATGVVLSANGTLTLAGSTLSSLAIFGNYGFAGNSAADTGFLAQLAVGPLATAVPQRTPALALWPNPVRSGEVVHLAGLSTRQLVEIRDVLGRVVLVLPVPTVGAVEVALPAELGSGTYFMQSGPQVHRFTVE